MRELSLNVMDIAQNSIRAGASLTTIRVEESVPADTLAITVEDNGCGMSEEQVKSVIDPFFTTRTTRKVGLGVPLFKMEAEMTAVFRPSHVDMIPLGDIASVMHLLITCNPEIDFVYIRTKTCADGAERHTALDTRELREQLGEVPFSEPEVSAWIRDYLLEMDGEIGA